MPTSLNARLAALQSQNGMQTAASLKGDPVEHRSKPGLARLGRHRARRTQQAEKKLFSKLAAGADNLRLTQFDGFVELERSIPLKRAGLSGPIPQSISSPLWPEPTKLDSLVFFDTETTGLAGGTGTLVFQVGLAWFVNGQLRVYQLILTRPARETDFLQQLHTQLAEKCTLVSYNGKSFDAPLLVTRCLMNRLPDRWSGLPHVDLLHGVRRAYRDRWPSCTLKEAESRLLGVERIDDLPGALAPAAWQAFLRGERCQPLLDVLRHNEQDVISLAGLAITLNQVYQKPSEHGANTSRVAHSWLPENPARAEQLLREAQPEDQAALRLLADIKRRAEGYASAINIWHKLAGHNCTESLRRLAIYYEHHAGDLTQAYTYARRLYLAEAKAENQQRLNRLAARMARA